MKIIAVDDEELYLESLLSAIRKACPTENPVGFRKGAEALAYISENGCDAVFLEIRMRGETGLVLAKKIKEIVPDVNIIFATGYSEYAVEAFRLYASDYLLKPIDAEQVRRAMNNLRNPVKITERKCIRLQCFGNFEAFADNIPIRFLRAKSKEILAYITDRMGAACTMGQLMSVLWEDGQDTVSRRSNLRNSISDLKQTLAAFGAEDIIIKKRNSISLNCDAVECDYFDFIKHKPYAVNLYRGEYMLQYSWAEMTTGRLE